VRRDGGGSSVVLGSGGEVPTDPDAAAWSRDLDGGLTLVLDGGDLSSGDQRILDAFAAQVGAALEHERLRHEAERATELAAANTLRGSLLQAVSHDLRTPLASIKASVSSLRQRDVQWAPEDVDEFEATIEREADRLSDIVANLLDMSRLQSSVIAVQVAPTVVEDAVLEAVAGLGSDARRVEVVVPDDLVVSADGALLERALVNLIGNAVRMSPPGAPVRVDAGAVQRDGRDLVDVRVVDRGPGIDRADRARVFEPFERAATHRSDGSGVGLGLTIARGFVQAMHGELTLDDTPGGGTTMTITLPAAPKS